MSLLRIFHGLTSGGAGEKMKVVRGEGVRVGIQIEVRYRAIERVG